MRRALKWTLVAVAAVLGLAAVLLVSFAVFFTIAEYRPGPVEPLPNLGAEPPPHPREGPTAPSELSLVTWNIGYCGLDRETDFFMDGGDSSTARSREAVLASLAAVTDRLRRLAAGVTLLQEVDVGSRRSFHVDQASALRDAFPEQAAFFAKNYDALFVPAPLRSPMGRVRSGIMTLSRAPVEEATRYQLPGQFGWPVRLFQLKRCASLVVIQSPLPGKLWHVLNLHLTAFDEGEIRAQELAFVRELAVRLYEEHGHFVVVGGDWNTRMPGVELLRFAPYTTKEERLVWARPLPEGFTPDGWTWAADPDVPTVRSNESGYVEGRTFRSVVDGFLLSPNVELLSVQGLDLGFVHSDHNPVVARVRAKLR